MEWGLQGALPCPQSSLVSFRCYSWALSPTAPEPVEGRLTAAAPRDWAGPCSDGHCPTLALATISVALRLCPDSSPPDYLHPPPEAQGLPGALEPGAGWRSAPAPPRSAQAPRAPGPMVAPVSCGPPGVPCGTCSCLRVGQGSGRGAGSLLRGRFPAAHGLCPFSVGAAAPLCPPLA